MVKLEELEDEHFINKPDTTKDGALLADDDEDYTDTVVPSLCLVPLRRGPMINPSSGRFSPSSLANHSHKIDVHDLTFSSNLDSEISDDDAVDAPLDESIIDRLSALRDIVPPKTRARFVSATQTVFSAANASVTFGGKSLWVIATSILLLGIPYALALGEEQQYMEEERQRGIMEQGTQGIIQGGQQPGHGDAKPAL
ncbi:hypothetical protein AYO20_03161 [Fonsecaea nubica]|uniref:Mitochondrial import receptor subunit tom22 n=1 Tax=Fonsecaea nubica TaxID=856822 RepID=A0A178D8G6_9EURO|nr:hypothetical protein AYO20_03161 [Fonsecaea nubica]OAL37654.1 hypothetical protein AYO20_03161 [Fonsecaea nubica]